MTKKIIAVSLVILLIAVSFVACGKDKGYKLDKDENGFEHAYVTDAEGNTVFDENGDIRVYETDKNGEIATDKDGNKLENVIDVPDIYTGNNVYRNDLFSFTVPAGWEPSGLGDGSYKKGNNTRCRLEINKYDEYDEEIDLETLMVPKIDFNKKVAEEAKKNYPDSNYRYETVTINNLKMSKHILLAKDNNGKVVHNAEVYYFLLNNILYSICYYNYDGEGYDATFDFEKIIADNLKIN